MPALRSCAPADRDIEALQAELAAERAARLAAEARVSSIDALVASLKLQIEKLRRELYGQRSERKARLLDQMELELEELEASATEDELKAEMAAAETTEVKAFTRKKPSKKPFPEHLPRERVVKRSQFGRSSEKVQRQIDQLELALEDLQTDRAADAADESGETDDQAEASDKQDKKKRGRKKLPAHLPRERSVLDPGDVCPDCGGALRLLGEDINELLDYVSAKLKVLQIARLKKSCRLCEKIVQEPAPSTPIQRGMAGAGLLSHILVSKFDDHVPLYRQGEIFARLGIDIPRSTLIGWTGSAIAALRPIAELIGRSALTATHLHCDDTIIPVLAPKTGQVKKGRMWVILRDGRPYQGSDPPAVVYFYSADRKGEHPRAFMKGFEGVLHADGFTGFNAMYRPDPETHKIQVKEAGCWAHWRRKFYDVYDSNDSPIAKEALDRIGKLYDVERTISGKTKAQRQAVRDAKSRPLVERFKTWLEARLKELPEKFDLTSAINYGLSKWDAFTLFLNDPAVAIDNNAAERAMRPLCIGRKNWMFAGSDRGAENAATIMTIIETAKANDLNPQAYIADLLNRLPDHKLNRLEDLAPWNWMPGTVEEAKAA